MSPRAKIITLCLLVFILGAGASFWYRDTRDTATATKGWCCVITGKNCLPSDSADSCQAAGGTLFDTGVSACNSACAVLGGT